MFGKKKWESGEGSLLKIRSWEKGLICERGQGGTKDRPKKGSNEKGGGTDRGG